MSENEHEMRQEDMDLKEDFSGLTEMSLKDNAPTQPPPKIDVSEALAQAQAQAQARDQDRELDDDEDGPQLPGVPRGMPPQGMMMGMPPGMGRPPQRPSFWQTLLNRGLIILAIAAVGIFVWWWWSRGNGGGGPVEAAEAAVNAARKTVVEPIQKALKLPPSL